MPDVRCSFCGTPIAVPPPKGQPPKAVAGPEAFICRRRVGMRVKIMSAGPEWRDEQIAVLSKSARPV
jgi:hypothetical protein